MENGKFQEITNEEMIELNGGSGFWYDVGYQIGQIADKLSDVCMHLCRS